MSEIKQACGKCQDRVENGILPITDIEQQDLDDIDEYEFFGIVQRPGVVTPANVDHEIYYTGKPIKEAPELSGNPLRIDHIVFDENPEAAQIGEVLDERLFHDEELYGQFSLQREMWNGFVEYVDDRNGNIGTTFNQLVRRVDAGELALSAGLSVATGPTLLHPYTVQTIREWNEVSLVKKPASPASWAWACEGSCEIIFGEQMKDDTFDVDLEALQSGSTEDDDSGLPPQIVEVLESNAGVQITDDGLMVIENEEDLVQSTCDCEEEYEQKIESLQEERDQYKQIVEQYQEQEQEEVEQRIRRVNEELPEDDQYSDEEIEQFIEDADSVSHLRQTADMIERVSSVSTEKAEQESKEEDLSGSANQKATEEEIEEAKQQVDQATMDLLGKRADDVFGSIEDGTFGEK